MNEHLKCKSCNAKATIIVITRSSKSPQCDRCAKAIADLTEVKFAAIPTLIAYED